jgi:hypothetical protein
LEVSSYLAGETSDIEMVRSQSSLLDKNEVFFLDDGFSNWIWVGSDVSEDIVAGLFSSTSTGTVDDVNSLETELLRRLFSMVTHPLRICVQGGIGHNSFLARMVEDQSIGLPSIEGMICEIQRLIVRRYF